MSKITDEGVLPSIKYGNISNSRILLVNHKVNHKWPYVPINIARSG